MRNEAVFLGGRASLIEAPIFEDARGTLFPVAFPVEGFLPLSAFLVCAPQGVLRGGHGHHRTRQLLMRVSGQIEVEMRLGTATETTLLSVSNRLLLIEPGVWAQQRYLGEDPRLLVFSDMPYDASDYFTQTPAPDQDDPGTGTGRR